jgi:hypothetical protein
MPNIKFSYLYRDSGNYKNYRSIIFENPAGIALSTLNEAIQSKLIDGTWFYAAEWGLPDLCSNTFKLTQHGMSLKAWNSRMNQPQSIF